MNEVEILNGLKKAIETYERDDAIKWAEVAIKEHIDPIKAIQEGLTAGILEVGRGFGEGKRFLPELVLSADIMKAASSILEEEIARRGLDDRKSSIGRIVIGTVAGDIHDIGKSIVSTILSANGFKVIDLGTDVPTSTFIEVVTKERPDILALSALLSTTIREQGKVIQALVENGFREKVKVIVGGGVVNEDHARSIGADGYGADAVEAVSLARRLLEKNE